MRPEDEASEPAPGRGQKPRYEVMATPSFTPGPDESPLMTWGDLAGTPLRLEAEDDIHVSAGEAGKLCSSSCCVGVGGRGKQWAGLTSGMACTVQAQQASAHSGIWPPALLRTQSVMGEKGRVQTCSDRRPTETTLMSRQRSHASSTL